MRRSSFFLEHDAQPDVFSSVGRCAWWAIETITSLGYGDMVPSTSAGRAFSSVLALWGIILFTIPGAVLSSGFVEVMLATQRAEEAQWEQELHRSLLRTASSSSHHLQVSPSSSNNGDHDAVQDMLSLPLPPPRSSGFSSSAIVKLELLHQKVDQIAHAQQALGDQLQQQQQQMQRLLALLEAKHRPVT